MSKFFIEVVEDSHRITVGKPQGYDTLKEALQQAEKHVDDALPRNWVRVCQQVAESHLGGDGGTYSKVMGLNVESP